MRDGFAKFRKEEPNTLAVSDDANGGMSLLPAAGAGKKNRIYHILINASANDTLTLNDLPIASIYSLAYSMILLDFGFEGILQTTVNTALTMTSTIACPLTCIVQYSQE